MNRRRADPLAAAAAFRVAPTLSAVSRSTPERRGSREAERFRAARMCYDHLAGRLGVGLTRGMVERGYLEPVAQEFRLTAAGRAFFEGLGLDVAALERRRRSFARRCLDRTERVPHLAGALGAAFAAGCFELGWIEREPEGRRVTVTEFGRRALGGLLPGTPTR